MYIFSILLPLSCQLSSRNSIFFITDLPHVHIRHYPSQPQREASSTSASFLVDNWTVPQEGPRMDKILHIQIPGSTYWCSTTSYQNPPAKRIQPTQRNRRSYCTSQPLRVISPLRFSDITVVLARLLHVALLAPELSEELSMYSPCGSDPHTSYGVTASTGGLTALVVSRDNALCSLSHGNLLM